MTSPYFKKELRSYEEATKEMLLDRIGTVRAQLAAMERRLNNLEDYVFGDVPTDVA